MATLPWEICNWPFEFYKGSQIGVFLKVPESTLQFLVALERLRPHCAFSAAHGIATAREVDL